MFWVTLILFATFVNSIQEIDFGKHDLYVVVSLLVNQLCSLLQNIGVPTDVYFTGQSLLAVTEKNVLASLSLKNASTTLGMPSSEEVYLFFLF
jgi:hypothetical protein